MANPQNLIPNSQRTPKQRRENARKAGIASGKARQHKKELKEIINLLFEKEFKDKNGEIVSGAEAIAMKQFEKALKGDTKAFEVLRDTAGQKPVDKVEQVNIDAEYKARVDEVRGYFERNNSDDTKQS